MKKFIRRLKRAPWSFKQPLTKMPKYPDTPVSDLFVWRISNDWNTFFELTDIAGMFDDSIDVKMQFVIICIFDNSGDFLHEEKLKLQRNKRITIDFSRFNLLTKSEYGTFCIFHSHTPKRVTELGSFLAERGYVGYRYKKAPLRSYAHGNLDAIAQHYDGKRYLLGARSFLSRKYNLQYQLVGPADYEIGVVNTTSSVIDFSFEVLSSNNEVIDIQKTVNPARGVSVFTVHLKSEKTARVIIKSHLVMARPLIFRIHGGIDVFHG